MERALDSANNEAVAEAEYQLFMKDELFIVRWSNPTAEACERLGEVLAARRESVGRPLFFAAMIAPDSPHPDKATREALTRGQSEGFELTSTMRLVILPGSMRQRLIHKLLVGMRMAAALRGQTLSVDNGLGDLTEVIELTLGYEPTLLLEQLVDAGVLSPDEIPTELRA